MDFDATGQLMIIYAAFVKYLTEKKNEAVHQLSTDFKKAYDSVRRKVLYNILTEFGIPMKLVRLIKVCQSETYSRVWVVKNLSDMFPIRNGLKRGDALLPLLFNCALEYAIRRVQVNQDSVRLNDKHELLHYADDVNMLGRSIHTTRAAPKLMPPILLCWPMMSEANVVDMVVEVEPSRQHSVKFCCRATDDSREAA